MTTLRFFRSGLFALALVGVMSMGLTGCGGGAGDPDQQLRERALKIYQPHKRMLESGSEAEVLQTSHEMTASGLDLAIDRYSDASEGLQRLLNDIRDGEKAMAEGRVSGGEAAALRQQHADYWASLERGELPADYQ